MRSFLKIISDPLANRSSCAVDFKVGSMDDPASMPGLSHLVEHVISAQFCDGRIGVFNGTTGHEHSNFRFETDHGSFIKALKVFANALNSPLISGAIIEAENKAITSELEKNRYDQSLLRSHIFNLTNNVKPIVKKKNVAVEDVREFLNSNYFASNAKIAIVSALPYEELKVAVDEAFNGFRPGNQKVLVPKKKIFSELELPLTVKADLEDSLILCFELPELYSYCKSKPYWILSYLMNTKRTGSLFSELKKLGLVTDVMSSVQPFSFSSLFFVEFKPTKAGLNDPNSIMTEFFSYVDLIKQKGYPEYLFKEQKDISELGFKFREQNDGMQVVKDLAKLMHYYPANEALMMNDVLVEYNKTDFNTLLNDISLNNLKILLSSQDFTGKKVDPYYGIKYSVESLSIHADLSKCNFKYPESNKFIAHDISIVNDDKEHSDPYKLIDDQRGVAWFLQDNVLKLPMSYFNLLLLSQQVNKTPLDKLLSIIYSRMVAEVLEEILDEAGEAGLSFGIDRDDRGISLFFSGYSQKMPLLFEEVFSVIGALELEQKTLDSIKNDLKNDYLNLQNGSSYSLAQYFKYQLMHKNSIPYTEYIDLIEGVTVKDLSSFINGLYSEISLDGHIYGNVSPKEVDKLYDLIFKKLSAKPLNKNNLPQDAIIKYGEGRSLAYIVETNSTDNCWSCFYQFGERTVKLSAIIQLGNLFLSSFFFDSIRGKKQLGYLAETRIEFFEKALGISFVILSDETSPKKLAKEAEATLKDFIPYLNGLSTEVFENSKKVLIERVNKNNRTLEDWMNDIFLTAVFKGDTLYAQKISKEVASLSIQELIEVFQRSLYGQGVAKLSVYAAPTGRNSLNKELVIEDIKDFKAATATF